MIGLFGALMVTESPVMTVLLSTLVTPVYCIPEASPPLALLSS